MKKQILELAKELGLNVKVKSERLDFDIIDYVVFFGPNQSVFTFFTGKTSSGITYPFDKELFINRVKNFLIS